MSPVTVAELVGAVCAGAVFLSGLANVALRALVTPRKSRKSTKKAPGAQPRPRRR